MLFFLGLWPTYGREHPRHTAGFTRFFYYNYIIIIVKVQENN
jgi:hypothetical protein